MKRLMILALALVPIGVVSLWELSDAATTDTAAASVDRTTAVVGEPVVFTSTNPCTTACSLTWRRPDIGLVRFGGVIVGRGEQITLTFGEPGSYQVVLDMGETCDGTSQLVCHSYASVFVDITGAPQPDPVVEPDPVVVPDPVVEPDPVVAPDPCRRARSRTARPRRRPGTHRRTRPRRRSGPRRRTGPRRTGPRRTGPRCTGPRRTGPRRTGPRSARTRRRTRAHDTATAGTQRPEHHDGGRENSSHMEQPRELGDLTHPRALQGHRMHQVPSDRRTDHVDHQLHRVSYQTRYDGRHLSARRLRLDGNGVLQHRGRDRPPLTRVASSTVRVGSARVASLVSCASGRSLSR